MVQIVGRIIAQAIKKLYFKRIGAKPNIGDVFKVSNLNEDSLYANLDWLTEN